MLLWCSRAADRASLRNRRRISPIIPRLRVQHLQGHPRLERLPLRLVNDAHPSHPDERADPVVAQSLGQAEARVGVAGERAGQAPRSASSLSISTSAGKISRISSANSGWRAAYSSGSGCSPRRSRADERLRQRVQAPPRATVAHSRKPSSPPGIGLRSVSSTAATRACSACWPPTVRSRGRAPISSAVSSSKWRRTRTSRSIGSRTSSTRWSRSRRSARAAARLGRVSRPRSCAARAADVASGNPGRRAEPPGRPHGHGPPGASGAGPEGPGPSASAARGRRATRGRRRSGVTPGWPRSRPPGARRTGRAGP